MKGVTMKDTMNGSPESGQRGTPTRVSVGSVVFLSLAAASLCLCFTSVLGQEPDPAIGDVFSLPDCPILDTPFDDRTRVFTDKGRELRVCCMECKERYYQESFFVMSKIDEQLVAQQKPFYPVTTCIVDDKPFADKDAINHIFRNRLFRLCGDKCRESLEKQPAKFFGKLDAAVVEKQKPNYPLMKCVVSGKTLGKDALDHVVANQLVRLASLEQLDKFNRTPGKYLEQVRKAAEKERSRMQ